MPNGSRDRRWATRCAVSGTVMMAAVSLSATASGAEASRTYTVTARSDAFSIEAVYASAPVFPGGQIFYASPSSSQAVIDSVGASTGFASAPYPGDTAVTAPGAMAALTGLPVPGYPFFVTSNHPGAPEASTAQGPFQAESTSTADDTVAEARVRLVPGDSPATAFASRATTK